MTTGMLQSQQVAGVVLSDVAGLVGEYDGQVISVVGGSAPGDGIFEGELYWDPDMTTEPADEVTFQPAGVTTGRWVLKSKIVAVAVRITDVSSADSEYLVAPVSGKIVKIYSILKNAITVANAELAAAIDSQDASGGFVAITGGAWTVDYDGSAAGDVDAATPTALNSVTKGDAVRVTTDGGSTTTAPLTVVFVFKGV